ncbi:hypothetical protein [Haladaptatus sp. DJG-WS-42]|uniref:hypothetical protein n=1 Tax=Haladaptatus sp. DJG-WS-42 TaxID=3120516 RepID=UPI0030D2E34C
MPMFSPQPITLVAVAGGFAATLVMTVSFLNYRGELPFPTTELWNRLTGGRLLFGSQYAGPIILLFLIGTTLAAGFPWVLWNVIRFHNPAYYNTFPEAMLTGIVFGMVFYGISVIAVAVGLIHVELTEGQALRYFLVHVLFGLVYGLWMGLATNLWYPIFF